MTTPDTDECVNEMCLLDLEAQKDLTRKARRDLSDQRQATRNARIGETIAVFMAVVFAAAVIVQAFN